MRVYVCLECDFKTYDRFEMLEHLQETKHAYGTWLDED